MYIGCSPDSDNMVIVPYRVTSPVYILNPLFKELGLKVSIANPKVLFHVILLLSNAQNDLLTQPTLTFTLKLAKVTTLKPIILD